MDRLKKCPGYEQGGFSEEQIGMLCKVADHQILYPEKKKKKKKKFMQLVGRFYSCGLRWLNFSQQSLKVLNVGLGLVKKDEFVKKTFFITFT